jgi:hypothetical protein
MTYRNRTDKGKKGDQQMKQFDRIYSAMIIHGYDQILSYNVAVRIHVQSNGNLNINTQCTHVLKICVIVLKRMVLSLKVT